MSALHSRRGLHAQRRHRAWRASAALPWLVSCICVQAGAEPVYPLTPLTPLTSLIPSTWQATAAPPGAAQNPREPAAWLLPHLQAAQAAAELRRQRAADAAQRPETLRAIAANVGLARLLALERAGDAAPPPGGLARAPDNPWTPAYRAAALATDGLYRLPFTLKPSARHEELNMPLTPIERPWSPPTLRSGGWPASPLTLKTYGLGPDLRLRAAS